MKEVITTTGVAAGTGLFAWLFAKMQTKRERKKSDFQLISETINPLLESIKLLTEQNNEVVGKLLCEQDKNLVLIREKTALAIEREELIAKIEKLEKQVSNLCKKIDQLKKPNNEKDNTTAVTA